MLHSRACRGSQAPHAGRSPPAPLKLGCGAVNEKAHCVLRGAALASLQCSILSADGAEQSSRTSLPRLLAPLLRPVDRVSLHDYRRESLPHAITPSAPLRRSAFIVPYVARAARWGAVLQSDIREATKRPPAAYSAGRTGRTRGGAAQQTAVRISLVVPSMTSKMRVEGVSVSKPGSALHARETATTAPMSQRVAADIT
jgi:hypothetical protein